MKHTYFYLLRTCLILIGCSLGPALFAGDQPCNQPSGTPGCSDDVCEAAVCAIDPYCCDTEWDGICVSEAAIYCGGDQPCDQTSIYAGCCNSECQATVCAIDEYCCDVEWDFICVAEAIDLFDNVCCGPNTPPTAECRDITVELDSEGQATIAAGDIDDGSSDAESGISLSVNVSSFNCDDLGDNTVTLTATDACNGKDNCTATVTVEDNMPPTAVCQDITVQLDAEGQTEITPADVDEGSFDNCPFGLDLDITEFACEDLGDNTVTLTATAENGPSDECTATVTVEDAPLSLECSGGSVTFNGEAAVDVAGLITAEASTVCGGEATLTYSPDVITCDQVGQQVQVIVTATGEGGEMVQCTTSVQVNGFPCGFMDTGGIGCLATGSFNAGTGTFTIQTSGCANTNPNSDQHGFIKFGLCGNGSISFRVASVSSSSVFGGIILRADLAPGAIKAEVVTNRASVYRGAVRETTNGPGWTLPFFSPGLHWLRLERLGNQIRVYNSLNGSSWSILMVRNLNLPYCVYVGMIAYGYGTGTATFDNVMTSGGFSNGNLRVAPNQALLPSPRGGETKSSLAVYPNPTSGQVTVELPADLPLDGAVLDVLDGHGRNLLRETRLDPRRQIDLSRLPAGVYFLRLQTSDGRQWLERVVVRQV